MTTALLQLLRLAPHAAVDSFFGAPGQAWRFQRVQFPSPARGPATSPGIEPWAHGGDNMG
jgi:hypothetical protein